MHPRAIPPGVTASVGGGVYVPPVQVRIYITDLIIQATNSRWYPGCATAPVYKRGLD